MKKREKSDRAALNKYCIYCQGEYQSRMTCHGGTLDSNTVGIHPPNMEYQPSGPPACPGTSKSPISPALLHGFTRSVAQMNGIYVIYHTIAALSDTCIGTASTAGVLATPKRRN